jgi:hypothetical protein
MARRRATNDDDPFDERGVLKDGRSFRVPLRMVDGRAVDASLDAWEDEAREQAETWSAARDGGADDAALRRPGWRVPGGGNASDKLLRDGLRQLRDDAYAARDAEVANAWRAGNPPRSTADDAGPPGDASDNSSQDGARARDRSDAAYAEYQSDLVSAWRQP